ncbi:MAG TPA: hypothetical protein VM537_00770 [Anaerolineae bacterium]|nr:hypothetical protein [Anaerolineae bacterium]
MDTKPDGRQYSRVTRRSIAIIKHLRTGRVFDVNEVAAEIEGRTLTDFYVKRFDRQMSVPRTREYIRYLTDLGAIAEQEAGYTRNFGHRESDPEWAQAFSDLAQQHLAQQLGVEPQEVVSLLEERTLSFHARAQLPTLDALAASFGIRRGRALEAFKCPMYMYMDGATCPFDLRAYPVVLKRGGQEDAAGEDTEA